MSLDELFNKTQKWLQNGISKSNEIKIDELAESRFELIRKCLDVISQIQILVQSSDTGSVDPTHDLIKISLHDMKTFNLLLKIIVIYGIHPCLDQGVGIPANLRMKKPDRPVQIEDLDDEQKQIQLNEIFQKLITIIKKDDDVADLIVLGSYNSDLIAGSIQLAFKDHASSKPEYFKYLKNRLDPYMLLTCYTSLYRRTSPVWFSRAISRQLALFPVDFPNNGVRYLIEFLAKIREKDTLSSEDLDRATKVLKAVPKSMNETEYSKIIGKQLLQILASDPNSPLVHATVHIVGNIYKQKPQIINNGLIDLLICIFNPKDHSTDDLTVEKAILACSALIKDTNDSGLISKISEYLLVNMWLMFCFMVDTHRPSNLVKGIIISLINTSTNDKNIEYLINSLMGSTSMFIGGENGGVSVKKVSKNDEIEPIDPFKLVQQTDKRVDLFMELLNQFNGSIISKIFVFLMKKWISTNETSVFLESNPSIMLANAKLLEKISQKQSSKLLKESTEIIQILCLVVNDYALKHENSDKPTGQSLVDFTSKIDKKVDSDDEGDSDDEFDEQIEDIQRLSVCLDLIETFLREKEILTDDDIKQLVHIRPSVDYLAEKGPNSVKIRSSQVSELLKLTEQSNKNTEKVDNNSREIYEKALLSLGDSMIPIKAHGLYLLRTLIESKDEIVGNYPMKILKIFLSQLKDDDSFIYLNAIKGISSIADNYGVSEGGGDVGDVEGARIVNESDEKVEKSNQNNGKLSPSLQPGLLNILLGHYGDYQVNIDERLRTGEALLTVIQKHIKTFTVQELSATIDMLIFLSGVRQSQKNVSEYRIRMSALSILGVICELNPLGIQPWLFDIVDCALGILTFEIGEEQTVLRRSAVVLIHSLVKGMPSLKGYPVNQIQMVVNRLNYCKENDIDGLVREQSERTIELIEEGW